MGTPMFYEINDYINTLNQLRRDGHNFILVFDRTIEDIRLATDMPETVSEEEVIERIEDQFGSFESIQHNIAYILSTYNNDMDHNDPIDDDDDDEDEDDDYDFDTDSWDDEHFDNDN
jgi:hypothetical protein